MDCYNPFSPCRILQAETESLARDQDHQLFTLLQLLLKICRECRVTRGERWTQPMNTIWGVYSCSIFQEAKGFKVLVSFV